MTGPPNEYVRHLACFLRKEESAVIAWTAPFSTDRENVTAMVPSTK